jgi:isopenicillin-N N-acyltransferase-like protein
MTRAPTIPVLELAGSPRDMGRAHGEHFRDLIDTFAQQRLDVCLNKAREAARPTTEQAVLDFCQSLLPIQADQLPDVHEEFLGIAEGAAVLPARLMIANAMTDVADVFAASPEAHGCSAWLVSPETTAEDELLAGQTWDMQPFAQDYVTLIRRRPAAGPASLVLTTAGCLSLVGINDAGLAVGNNNLIPTDARPGLMYLALIHHALTQTSLAAAVNAVENAQRLSGHNYYFAGPDHQMANLETTAQRAVLTTPTGGFFVHTNHYLAPELRPFEFPDAAGESTLYRHNAMGKRLHEHAGEITPALMMDIMADRTGRGDCNICRRDDNDPMRTCAAIIMNPAAGKVWAVKGPPDQNPFQEFAL